jgi:1-acyl-sn-glycerol-3-phosphate acyltransferase
MFRRVVAISAVAAGLPIWLILTPVWVVFSVAFDVASRLWRLPSLRLCCFFAVYLIHEWAGVIAAAWLWVTGSFGRRLNLDSHRRVQAWWATSLLNWARRLLSVELDIDDHERFPAGTFIMLSRHASMVDAVIPAAVVTGTANRFAHYVLKRELRWDPALDLFGTRLGNHFVARSGRNTEGEAAAIETLARDAIDGAGLVIFPEGTYATDQTRARVLRSLRKAGESEVVALAESLGSLLPPRPAGTLAFLRGRPDADVVVVGHVGLGGVAQLRGLRRRLPLTEPVVIRWWVHRRSEIPDDEPGQETWLNQRWAELDQWVTDRRGHGLG